MSLRYMIARILGLRVMPAPGKGSVSAVARARIIDAESGETCEVLRVRQAIDRLRVEQQRVSALGKDMSDTAHGMVIGIARAIEEVEKAISTK